MKTEDESIQAAKDNGDTISDNPSQIAIDNLVAFYKQAYNAGIEAVAVECNRQRMFSGGRSLSYAHDGLDAASTAIRALKEKE